MSVRFENDPEFNRGAPKSSPGRGARFIEVLVVLCIVVLLVAILLPATRSVGPAGWRAQCVNNLKQIGLALHNYEQAYGALPPAYTVDAKGRPLHSWRTLILPYLEQEPLYRTIDLSKPWNDPANAKALETPVPVYQCPESPGPGEATTYLAVVGPDGCLAPDKPRRLAEITGDHGSTLMVVEAGEINAVPWMAPTDADESFVSRLGIGNGLRHTTGINACTVNGSVVTLGRP